MTVWLWGLTVFWFNPSPSPLHGSRCRWCLKHAQQSHLPKYSLRILTTIDSTDTKFKLVMLGRMNNEGLWALDMKYCLPQMLYTQSRCSTDWGYSISSISVPSHDPWYMSTSIILSDKPRSWYVALQDWYETVQRNAVMDSPEPWISPKTPTQQQTGFHFLATARISPWR